MSDWTLKISTTIHINNESIDIYLSQNMIKLN